MPASCARARRAPRSAPSSTCRRRSRRGSPRPASTPTPAIPAACCCAARIDAQGKSRAWINGSGATVAQLREAAEQLVDIHGQHAWQGLTRRARRARACSMPMRRSMPAPLAARWSAWRARGASARRRAREAGRSRARARAARLADRRSSPSSRPAPTNGPSSTPSTRAWRTASRCSRRCATRSTRSPNPTPAPIRSPAAPSMRCRTSPHSTPASQAPLEALQGAQAQLQDAAHTLAGYLDRAELDPERLREVEERLSAWVTLARRHRRPPAELPALLAQWQAELRELDAAADLDALERASDAARAAYDAEARRVSAARRSAAPKFAAAVTKTMQQLGMAGGRFEVALVATDAPQSFGIESVEFLVAGHAGTTPRPLAQGRLGRRAVAHRARGRGGRHRAREARRRARHADLRRDRRRHRRRGRRDRRPPHEAARPRPPGARRDPPAAGRGLRRPPFRRQQAARRAARRRAPSSRSPAKRASPRSRACSVAKSSLRRASPTRRKCSPPAPSRAPRTARPRHEHRAQSDPDGVGPSLSEEGLASGAARRPASRRRGAGRPPVPARVVLVTGISGSGKSVALHALGGRGLLLRRQPAARAAARFPSPRDRAQRPAHRDRRRRAQRRLAAAPAAPARAAARRRHRRAGDLSRRDHRRAGAALLGNAARPSARRARRAGRGDRARAPAARRACASSRP